jgi:redox-sensitive bicupin YhaK (pirin superfamily)
MSTRSVKRLATAQPAVEGAGVHLRRAFGFGDTTELDPFLLLDDFRNDEPAKYAAGFPWHPHRGMETITYVLEGEVEHRDSIGNRGLLGPGDVQWMTAGSGIVHQELPKGDAEGRMYGFQLWANLPAEHKWTEPRYQDVKAADIPLLEEGGTEVRLICGSLSGETGPVQGIAADPLYLDVTIPPGEGKSLPAAATRNAFAYVFSGSGNFGAEPGPAEIGDLSLVVFGAGDHVVAHAGEQGLRFLFVSGEPLAEPVAWRGPIVMNTQEELRQAFRELDEGTFLKTAR